MDFGFLYDQKKERNPPPLENPKREFCPAWSNQQQKSFAYASSGQPVPSTSGGFLSADRARGERACPPHLDPPDARRLSAGGSKLV